MTKRILILEDDARLAESLRRDFEDHSYEVFVASRLSEIPSMIFTHAVVDMRLGAGDHGLEGITTLKEASPGVKIVVLSGYGSIVTAVEAVKRGAIDYLTKPAGFEDILAAFRGERVSSSEEEFRRRSLSEVEHEYIDFVLARNDGNITQTAKDLGLHRQSLQRKLKKYT